MKVSLKRKDVEDCAPQESNPFVYLIGGLVTGPHLTAILNRWHIPTHKMTRMNYSCSLVMKHSASARTFIGLFIVNSGNTKCVLFERTSGNVKICDVILTQLDFELPMNAMWDDDYQCVPQQEVTKKAKKCNTTINNNESLRYLATVATTAFAPNEDIDNLFHFSAHVETLINEKTKLALPASIIRSISAQCDLLERSHSGRDSIITLKHPPKNDADDTQEADIINLLGRNTFCVRIQVSRTKAPSFQTISLQRQKRCADELELGSQLWEMMSAQDLARFTSNEFEKLLRSAESTPHHPLPEPSCHKLNLEHDADRCDVWMKFIRAQLAPKMCLKMTSVTIKLLQIPSALFEFEVQILKMKESGTPVQPRIMFHGVGGSNVASTVSMICKRGFNVKCAKRCVYGAGGTYCSPQIACALDYTTKVSETSQQKCVFVCMVVPGKVCYGGLDGQQMSPDQHSWAHDLDNGQQIYCAETILPFALLTFVH